MTTEIPLFQRVLTLGDLNTGEKPLTRDLDYGNHGAFAKVIWEMEDGPGNSSELHDAANRIVVCVNAFTGIRNVNDFMESAHADKQAVATLSAEVSRLRMSLAALKPYLDAQKQAGDLWPAMCADAALTPQKQG